MKISATAWVTTKRPKIGAMAVTLSFTPRRFMIVSSAEPGEGEGELVRDERGRKLKTASAPEEIEMVIVRT